MAGPEFWQTMLGRKFYDHDVPELTKSLNRLAAATEAQVSRELEDNDYTLKEGRVWITVGKLSVHVVTTDEGVVVDIYPVGKEDEEPIASTYAFDREGETEEEG